jgi:hypothetical protein
MRDLRAGLLFLFDELCHVFRMLRQGQALRYINCGSASIQL